MTHTFSIPFFDQRSKDITIILIVLALIVSGTPDLAVDSYKEYMHFVGLDKSPSACYIIFDCYKVRLLLLGAGYS